MDFKGYNYIVLGGTTGLGLSSAIGLKKSGARVLAIGRSSASCEKAQDELGSDHIVFSGDATNEKTIEQAIELAGSRFGRIHGLFHVAGGSGRKFGDGPLDQMSIEAWNKTFELNLSSIMLSNKAMINYFLENKLPGKILNMGSVLASSPSPKYFVTHAYAAAKSALIGFSKSIASYYAPNNISINVIAPALFETPMAQRAISNDHIQTFIRTKQPLDGGRPGIPEDIVNAVLMFLSPSTKFITGQVLKVDGGWSISEGQYS